MDLNDITKNRRAMRFAATAALVAAVWAVNPAHALAEVRTRTVEYRHGDTVLEGYLAYDDVQGVPARRPTVLVTHDWMGLGEHARTTAERLAVLGYTAFAVDIYGKGVRPAGPQEAGELASLYKGDRPLAAARIGAALDFVRGLDQVDPERIAATGYCFGGMVVLELARAGADVAGVVSFHGTLNTPKPAAAGAIRAKVLALHGADDPYVPDDEVAAFEREMREAGADWQLFSYGGAVHAFTNPQAGSDPSKGAAYNEQAGLRSWEAMKSFLAEVLKTGK